MSVTIEHKEQSPQTALITVNGRLLLGPGCQEMERTITDLLERGYLNLTFDVGGVTHIDSTGMGRFIDAYNRLQPIGGTVHVVGAKGPVRDMFHVTRLDTIFRFD
jgi:anti-anti-sigma factor